jgi:hypothetical protein
MLSAPVPRNLRVRSSIQISTTRVPARAFLIVAGSIFCGGLLVVGGADLLQTVRLIGACIVIGLLLFEFRCWGRSMGAVSQILIQHYRRPRGLRLDPLQLMLPAETGERKPSRQLRWKP